MKRQWLKNERVNRNLTLCQVSEKIGISESYYSLIESGDRNVPVKTARKIANALGFEWTRFFDETAN
jgi:putative transcriptional regulator